MTLLGKALRNVAPPAGGAVRVNLPLAGGSGVGNGSSYLTNARVGYAGNEIVFSAIELLATSAAEPHIIGKRWRRNRREIRAAAKAFSALGIHNRAGAMALDALMVTNGFIEELTEHPLVRLLNNPNPVTSRGQLWSTVVMDLHLAGNAYLLKGRYSEGFLAGAVGELWRMRPDRVRVVVRDGQIDGYEYMAGNAKQVFAKKDVIHFKTRNPFDDFYGMPPMMPISGRVTIDNYMRGFLQTFFERGGTGPGSVLTIKGKAAQADKDDARDRFKRQFGGQAGWHEMLILDNTDGATWQQLGLARGLRDALPKELDAVNEARIAMVFGIPGSVMGLLIGYESSSYANKRQDWQVLWDLKMTPMLSEMDDVLNLELTPEFGGVDEVCFDLSDIRALQEDVDKLHDRHRKDLMAGGISLQRYWELTGEQEPAPDDIFLVPGNMVPTKARELGKPVEEASTPAAVVSRALTQAMAMIAPPDDYGRRGRPRIEDDPEARVVYDEAMRLREQFPRMTWAQISTRVGMSDRQLRELRARLREYEDEE